MMQFNEYSACILYRSADAIRFYSKVLLGHYWSILRCFVMFQTYFDIWEGILSMFFSNSITLENSEKIIVVGKESGLAFFGALFALIFWLCIAIYNLNLFTIIVAAVIGLFTLFVWVKVSNNYWTRTSHSYKFNIW